MSSTGRKRAIIIQRRTTDEKEIKTEKVKTTPEERLHHAREYAERCLREEAEAVLDLIPQLDENFEKPST